jgi:hypothetical protein
VYTCLYRPVEQMTRSAHTDTASEPLKNTVRYFTGEGSHELQMSYDHSCHLACINKLYPQAISSLDLLFVLF